VKLIELTEGRVIVQTPHAIAVVENPVQEAGGQLRQGCLIRADVVDVLAILWSADPNPRAWYVVEDVKFYGLGGRG
jgi:hypothetical protein